MQNKLKKTCCNCNAIKPISEFHKDANNKSGYRGCCKKCIKGRAAKYYLKYKERIDLHQKEYAKNNIEQVHQRQKLHYQNNRKKIRMKHKLWHEKNKESVSMRHKKYDKEHPDIKKNRSLIYLYGITLEKRNNMIKKQNGLCGCCGESFGENTRRVHVDHCHTTGKVRKIICASCNMMIGKCEENPKKVLKILKYIKYCNALKEKI